MYIARTFAETVFNSRTGLGLADAEYFGAAVGAFALSGRALVLEGRFFRILDFYFLSTFHTISLGHLSILLILDSVKQSNKPAKICQ